MVLAYDGRSNEYRITLKGTLSHTVTLGADVFGNITRLDNALENLAGSLQAEQNSLEETKAQLENARTELAAPFARGGGAGGESSPFERAEYSAQHG